ncbi:uncharacterized protein VICG_00977 [Vittaforma corneae ATCC 50505]|uniref:Uncharacterized protein n=1 Tax=Vittaforma corneae (strain ATCC 50505) TaxID=993615 RepID=L2GN84_VITCO|nr:uncharacterized protein VICG_00977 [Vittaforma corneae ATCC 50505]ELA41960.1 hypothetical protein VICG_00977 [Vittaforma corneae ATCC 50505]
MTNAHIEPHAETNIHMHPILDTFVFYFTSLPNAELATILTYIISFSFVSKLAINHVKKHFRNYSLMSCYEFVFKSVFIIVLRIICTLMCYIIYIHLRIECLKISYCIILMMVPLGQFVYYLMTDFKSIAVPSFLRLLASSRLSMFIFWGLSLAELLLF